MIELELEFLEFDRSERCHCEDVKTSRISVNEILKASSNAEMTKIKKRLKIPKLARNFGERGTEI